MTLKQDEFIRKLPENGYNIGKTMREVGYSRQTSRSGAQYALLRKRVDKAFSPDSVKDDILKAKKKFWKDNDNSNIARMVELGAKVAHLTDQNTAIQVNIMGELDKEIAETIAIPVDNKP